MKYSASYQQVTRERKRLKRIGRRVSRIYYAKTPNGRIEPTITIY